MILKPFKNGLLLSIASVDLNIFQVLLKIVTNFRHKNVFLTK